MKVQLSNSGDAHVARSVQRFAEHARENCAAVGLRLEELKHDAGLLRREWRPHLNFAVLRSQTALRQTESVLEQTAKSLQKTAGLLASVAA